MALWGAPLLVHVIGPVYISPYTLYVEEYILAIVPLDIPWLLYSRLTIERFSNR